MKTHQVLLQTPFDILKPYRHLTTWTHSLTETEDQQEKKIKQEDSIIEYLALNLCFTHILTLLLYII